MKRLFVFVIFLFLLQIVKAAPPSIVDTSGFASKVVQANMPVAKNSADTIMVPVAEPAAVSFYQNNLFKRRLDSIQKDVPLDYNEYVQSYIDLYLNTNRRADLGRVVGLTKYYFPIYDQAFREAGIPEEIAYLSIVESQLNPYAVSRVGATGLWQFMSNTAKTYDLTMDSYIDERRDPVQSSRAAAAYLKDAYQEFGDWLLAIASYNCGKSNVVRAIEKAGANDFWSIRQYLPVETRGYVPAYIAITYVMNYYKKYNIVPQNCSYDIKTDTVSVSKCVSLNSVGRALNIDPSQIAMLNPAYLQQIVNATPTSPRILVIPQSATENFTTSYTSMNSDIAPFKPKVVYAAVAEKRPDAHQVVIAQKINNTAAASSNKKSSGEYISYRVQPGDTLSVIANKFGGTSVEELKKLNGLKTEDVQPGMMLMINKG